MSKDTFEDEVVLRTKEDLSGNKVVLSFIGEGELFDLSFQKYDFYKDTFESTPLGVFASEEDALDAFDAFVVYWADPKHELTDFLSDMCNFYSFGEDYA